MLLPLLVQTRALLAKSRSSKVPVRYLTTRVTEVVVHLEK